MCDEPAELQVQCAMLEGLLLMMPLTADAAGVGDTRDPTDALIRTLVPVVLRVRLAAFHSALDQTASASRLPTHPWSMPANPAGVSMKNKMTWSTVPCDVAEATLRWLRQFEFGLGIKQARPEADGSDPTVQNKDVDECHGELRQLCIAVLNARAGLRQRAASLLPSGPAVSMAPMPTAHMPGKRADGQTS